MTKTTRKWRELAASVGFLNWLFNPLQRSDVRSVYDLLLEQSPTTRARYLNLGYWAGLEPGENTGADSLDDACDALVRLVGKRAGLGADDRLLDVGFGFGDQDLLWWREFAPKRIVGLNITASQVAVARKRVAAQELSQQIDLRLGSATAMPVAAGSVDVIIALECAFHFQTRERFFAEALRVLRPGGRLVLADIIPMPLVAGGGERWQQRLTWALVAGKFAIPKANAYPLASYVDKLAEAGFAPVEVESIRHDVYQPLHAHLREHPDILARLHPLLAFAVRLALKADAKTLFSGLDYVLASAIKPGGAPAVPG
ncbi:SAM-dependent methyltransferase [Thiorhodovibrio frisius]|uniref:Methylase involved in ubiquinone/menaquinone biosynthesis n=1 Tax=Thiorhodovibrio frisius TaxID=631362 RepID=H8Z4Z1_9GAMM|nr:methyltransferase domain-containing protein [Thiorhodovibrio frisius]EIC20398.1 methylase involved in ubiquinone/menaquinone biosynthesis [Thiorhodovibrio frisius]WPL21139.1 Erythromycin 3''-O-methyltransferase [Thiorhodovibrio frisius]